MDLPTRDEKAALLLLSLGPEAAENVLAQISPHQQERLRARMMRQKQTNPPKEILDQAVREFDDLLRNANLEWTKPREPPPAPVAATALNDEIRSLLEAEKQAVREKEKEGSLPADADVTRDPIAALSQVTVEQLAMAFQGESPRAISMVLSCIANERAAAVLKLLPVKVRVEAMVQLGMRITDDKDLLPRIARAILQKCRSASTEPAVTHTTDEARHTKTADILRMLEEKDRTQIMNTIEQKDKKLAATIRDFLYYFDDIIFIEDRSLQRILSGLDPKHLATALKGASQQIVEKVMQNVSSRVQEGLSEEMELMGAVPAMQVEKARSEIVDIIQRLDQAGELVTTRKRST